MSSGTGGERTIMDQSVHSMTHARHCAEIVTWTGTLTALTREADLTADVPTCPGWNLAQLVRHVGAGHRWVETIVRTAATEPPPDTALRELSPEPHGDRAALAEWLATGAA
ncbi:maleylpyruvate isomerase N-terminal domain-containing protein, partial [Saccharomonospora saliphila]|uniref:maleylpyruvate isomerase N-terminal domain-containing protein n=1 Tax=Saccharomonospora saliphila TaxID=369829 RepID=UPI001E4C8F49